MTEMQAIAAVVEAWEPGMAVTEDGAVVATDVDGVLVVEVVEAPVSCR